MTTPGDLLNHCAEAACVAWNHGWVPSEAEEWRNVASAVLAAQRTHTPSIPVAAVRALASGRPVAEVAEEFGVEVGVVREVAGMVGSESP